jgi:sialic acid synthase SpsE
MTLRQQYRLSCVAARDLPAGHRLVVSDISFSRPGTGMLPKAEAWLLGKLLTKSVLIGHVFKTDDFAV